VGISFRRRTLGFAAVAIAGGFAGILATGPADAAQIFVCQPSAMQPCTSPPERTATGGESNLITTPGAFDIGVAGNFTLQNPLLVGVALVNGVGTASISFGAVSQEPLATAMGWGRTRLPASRRATCSTRSACPRAAGRSHSPTCRPRTH
jgi:hypothetical protein